MRLDREFSLDSEVDELVLTEWQLFLESSKQELI